MSALTAEQISHLSELLDERFDLEMDGVHAVAARLQVAGSSPRGTALQAEAKWLDNGGSAASPLRGLVLPPCARLPTGQRPPPEVSQRVGDAFRGDDAVPVQRPTMPLRPQRAEIAQAKQPQQLHHRPGHPIRAAIPCLDRGHRATEQPGARLDAQQAGIAKLPEAFRADVPDPATWGRP